MAFFFMPGPVELLILLVGFPFLVAVATLFVIFLVEHKYGKLRTETAGVCVALSLATVHFFWAVQTSGYFMPVEKVIAALFFVALTSPAWLGAVALRNWLLTRCPRRAP